MEGRLPARGLRVAVVHVPGDDPHVLLLRGEHPQELVADVGADPRYGPLSPGAKDPGCPDSMENMLA